MLMYVILTGCLLTGKEIVRHVVVGRTKDIVGRNIIIS